MQCDIAFRVILIACDLGAGVGASSGLAASSTGCENAPTVRGLSGQVPVSHVKRAGEFWAGR